MLSRLRGTQFGKTITHKSDHVTEANSFCLCRYQGGCCLIGRHQVIACHRSPLSQLETADSCTPTRTIADFKYCIAFIFQGRLVAVEVEGQNLRL